MRRTSIPTLSSPATGRTRVGARVAWLAAVALALGCRTVQLQPTQVSSDAVLLTVPVVPQDDLYECGLASISALSCYHGVDIPVGERERLVDLATEERGLSGGELRQALEAAGTEVFVFPGTLDHEVSGLFHHIDNGRPLLVMISVQDEVFHYCLFTGYDPEYDNVFLLDPRRGSLVLPTSSFAALWSKSDNFTLLCVPARSADRVRTIPRHPPESKLHT